MKSWQTSPADTLVQHFRETVQPRMADLPFLNPLLAVEAIGFRQVRGGQWVGVLLTPWSCSLLCLPGPQGFWPDVAAGEKYSWEFPSGTYEFVVAVDANLGPYHQCPLFTGVQHFTSLEEARLTALAVMLALEKPQIDPVPAASNPESEPVGAESSTQPQRSRRAFLGLGRA